MGCSRPLVKTECNLPPLPPDPLYYPVVWKAEGKKYTLDETNAKNEKKNWDLVNGLVLELKAIIEGMRTK